MEGGEKRRGAREGKEGHGEIKRKRLSSRTREREDGVDELDGGVTGVHVVEYT